MFRDRLSVVPDHPLIKDAIKARAKKGLDEKSFKEGDWVVATLKRHALVDGNFSRRDHPAHRHPGRSQRALVGGAGAPQPGPD